MVTLTSRHYSALSYELAVRRRTIAAGCCYGPNSVHCYCNLMFTGPRIIVITEESKNQLDAT